MPASFRTGPVFTASNIRRFLIPIGILIVLMVVATRSGAAERAWHVLTGHRAPVEAPVLAQASKPVLSDQERQRINKQDPQTQMEELMRAAINHEEGSTQMIAGKLPYWRDRLKNTKNWNDLMMTALYSNDLRVRAAAIEINLEVFQLSKTPATVDQIIHRAEDDPTARPWAAWMLGMLANRGVSTDKVVAELEDWAHDPDEQTRLWAVEGLALVGTDNTINDFVSILKNDDSSAVRERASASLAKSGMLTRVQRMHAVPGLIDLVDDSSLNDETHKAVYKALREITEQNMTDDCSAWRNWYLDHGQEAIQKFAKADANQVLGNS